VLAHLTSDKGEAIPITPVTRDGFTAWLVAAAEIRPHLAQGYRLRRRARQSRPAARTGRQARPHSGRRRAGTIRCGSLAALPDALPEGRYTLGRGELGPGDDDQGGALLGARHLCLHPLQTRTRGFATLVWPERADRAEIERLAFGIFLARDLINTPAEDMGPAELAAAAKGLAERAGAACSVIVGNDLLAMNYGTVQAVGRASVRPPCLIDLRWGSDSAPKVTLVGKGVCFDSGGLDLKPAAGMKLMKKDMGGAAILLGLASALIDAKLPIRLRVLIPAVENAVSANAFRPMDVIRTRSGKTVEIGNTDAEGRLILCDALAEADSEKPALIIDAATLTGAARVALGPDLPALFCNDETLAAGLLSAGIAEADPLWRMPLWQPYRKLLDSKVRRSQQRRRFALRGLGHRRALPRRVRRADDALGASRRHGVERQRAAGRPEGGEAMGLRALYAHIKKRFT